jgi:hypothetical protein
MGWLRRDKDCIALVVVWALLLQAALLSFVAGAHAAGLASGESAVLCTLRGPINGDPAPGQGHRKADHACCTTACRLACGGPGNAGLLPPAFRVPLSRRRPSQRASLSLSAHLPRSRLPNRARPLALKPSVDTRAYREP